jgi:hypothetical protein
MCLEIRQGRRHVIYCARRLIQQPVNLAASSQSIRRFHGAVFGDEQDWQPFRSTKARIPVRLEPPGNDPEILAATRTAC